MQNPLQKRDWETRMITDKKMNAFAVQNPRHKCDWET